ncbi:MAG: ABC transporter substrate-binding protein [[Actinobacillus] rossii]|uniref:Extracellular solute-binding protein n=1 Tax=[Actinobacillus] rossii TaxID=123820 RepID=A0A380TU33_9PAST|nr:ABC transporter substrate-binding protein [[Actinobacillus] rossii]MDY4506740.1 ABC transporter substrate-binding protein [[Actinobacillus] rossii]SUT92104.1 extracellular solute-binding protein [[Actinobacillus] rossii]
MFKFLTALSVILATSAVFAAPRVPDEVKNNGLVYCTHATGFSFNPQTADAGTSMNVVTEQIYNKLFELKTNSSQVEPSLAQSYEFSEDGKVLTIYLRKGVKFHRTPWFIPSRDFNADDVVFSINRVLGHNTSLPEFSSEPTESTNRQYQIFYSLAKKTRFPYFESIKLNQKIERVESADPYTVKIFLVKPDASILSHLASQYAIIFSHEYALQLNADDNIVQLDTLPVGTGAYQLKDYFRSQYVRLVRNPYYWKEKAKLENIIIDLSTDKTGRLAKFLNNECQLAAFPEASQLGLLQDQGERFQTHIVEGMNLSFLAFNFLRPVMQDVEIRRAISQAINRQRIIKHIYYDTATVANNIIPSVSWAASSKQSAFDYDYNPEKARNILNNKGLSLDMWVLKDELIYNPSPIKMAEMIKFDLAQVGVDVKVRLVSRNFLMQNLHDKTEDYDLILSGWLASSLDPDAFLRPILSCSTVHEVTNLSNWCSPLFDVLLSKALTSNNPNLRAVDYHLAQQEILSQLPILPIANVKRVLISNTNVQGVEMSAFGNVYFEKLKLKKGQN